MDGHVGGLRVQDQILALFDRITPAVSEFRTHMDDPAAVESVANAIEKLSAHLQGADSRFVIICIGSDRSIGDSLGPLTGTLLTSLHPTPHAAVLGTLDSPVHAGNLNEVLQQVKRDYGGAKVMALDACLGRSGSVGSLAVGLGSLKPGSGVNKELPAVGDMYLTGVVNVGGFMEYFVLQNTRLSLVYRMALIASRAIQLGFSRPLRR